jgi:hypothetical protein
MPSQSSTGVAYILCEYGIGVFDGPAVDFELFEELLFFY